MKNKTAQIMAAVLLAAALTGCSGQSAQGNQPPEELAQVYADAILAHGGEMVEYNPVITQVNEENAILLESMGLEAEDMTAFALSTTMMNTKAYGIAAVMPVRGREEAVESALEDFVARKQADFERYLPDQYDVARNAEVETLDDGTVLLVMAEDGDRIFEEIAAAIRVG